MKICKLCKNEKPLDQFYKNNAKGKRGQIWPTLDPYCCSCRSAYQSQRKRDLKSRAVDYLGGCCKHCGLIDHPCVYDFHHLDPDQKEFTLGKIGGRSFNKIVSELDKCILLCSNCHRKVHSTLII